MPMLQSFVIETALFSASGFLLFGIDDLIFDCAALICLFKRKLKKLRPISNRSENLHLAVFVPAWKEDKVIGQMLSRCSKLWAGQPVRVFLGCYPNDLMTQVAASECNWDQICVTVLDHPGPTTKADCLNGLWKSLVEYENINSMRFSGVILHDAEDMVHRQEIALFADYIDRFALIQIPVIPTPNPKSEWISGHYLDEFAEAHLKDLVTRESLGASLPSAGTGCAINRDVLARFARQRKGLPFDADSLTEDYELGLRISEAGYASKFVRHIEMGGTQPIAVRSCFPCTIGTSVRQKARWIIGIALSGWDRTGWHGGIFEHWMRWRDRRVMMSALFIVSAYVSLMLFFVFKFGNIPFVSPPVVKTLLQINAGFLCWRIAVRIICTTIQYDWKQGLLAGPRIFVSNIIAIMAAWRALVGYLTILINGKILWDKTDHEFPPSTDFD
jgi:bacteriophage N4 adsorption protein B